MSRTCPGHVLFPGFEHGMACWVPCPGHVLVSESWVAPDHRPIFYLAKFVWQNKIFFFIFLIETCFSTCAYNHGLCIHCGANIAWSESPTSMHVLLCPGHDDDDVILCPFCALWMVITRTMALAPDMSWTCHGTCPFCVFLDTGRGDILPTEIIAWYYFSTLINHFKKIFLVKQNTDR